MKILSCQVHNFASYKQLEFDFSGQGLTLIAGPTGSGKSTLCDVLPWVLFGKTAKGGSVDEVRTWGEMGITTGVLNIQVRQDTATITRLRGNAGHDLSYRVNNGEPIRGKDLTDTQRLLNQYIGSDFDLYLSGAYFHEFSDTAQFFTTTAKNRRQLTEQLVDLTLAVELAERTSSYKKEVKNKLQELHNELNVKTGVMKSVEASLASDKQMQSKWEANKKVKLEELKSKRDDYMSYHAKRTAEALKEHEKQQTVLEDELLEIEKSLVPEPDLLFYRASLTEEKKQHDALKDRKCPTCGGNLNRDREVILLKRGHELTQKELSNDNKKKLLNLKIRELSRHNEAKNNMTEVDENPYVKQLESLILDENPHTSNVRRRSHEFAEILEEIRSVNAHLGDFNTELKDLELLTDVIDSFRSVLIRNTVLDLETSTNKIIRAYFDAEIQVKFELSDVDKLDVNIWKDGNQCVFTQLSKGQRQLLKLAFSVSVMKCVTNHHGISFNAIFFDEALDGLDDVLKVKAYDLLQQLSSEHESVFVVEHNESLKTMFPNRFDVRLTDEGSKLAKA